MFGIENYLTFLISGIILNLTPGQDTLYILGRSTAQGKNAGIASALGIGAGSIVHTLAAAFGLSIILMKSALAFEIICYAGAAYLIYLGIQMLIRKNNSEGKNFELKNLSYASLFRKGMMTNILNPKVALFYLSFLPQFVNPQNEYGALPFIVLGLTFVITGTAWCIVLAAFSSMFTKTLREKPFYKTMLDKVSGGIFILLGIKMALQKR